MFWTFGYNGDPDDHGMRGFGEATFSHMDDAKFDRFMELFELRFQDMEARFEQMEARFEQMEARFELRFQQVEAKLDQVLVRIDRLESRFDAFQIEMAERFQSVNDRLDSLERRVGQLGIGMDEVRTQLSATRAEVDKLTQRMDRLETSNYEIASRVNALSDDMRQRFRGVTDRLAAVEQRLAA